MKHPEVTIRDDPGVVLARVAPTLLTLFGADSIVLGGGTVLAARWNHREPVRDPAYPDLLRGLAPRARRLFESAPASVGANEQGR